MSEVTFGGNTIGDKAIYLNGVERGKKQERERIIKLLEAECCELLDCKCEMRIIWAIALIKGEK